MDLKKQFIIPSSDETRILTEIVEQVRPMLLPGRSHEVVEIAERLGQHSARGLSRISSRLSQLLTHRSRDGVSVVDLREFSRGELAILPPTPRTFVARTEHQMTSLDVARCAIIGAAGGFSYCFSDQAEGTLCDDVMPLQMFADTPGFSSGTEVGWHTEDASFNRSDDDNAHPTYDVISFCYLRNPFDDPTLVTTPDLSQLDINLLEELRKNQFVTKTSIAQGHDKNTLKQAISLVYGDNKMRFSFARLPEQRANAEYDQRLLEIIDRFIDFLNRFRLEIPSLPGMLTFIDNMRVAHARGPWRQRPAFDGSDRWQRRLGCACSFRRKFLETLMPIPELRVIDNAVLKSYLKNLNSD